MPHSASALTELEVALSEVLGVCVFSFLDMAFFFHTVSRRREKGTSPNLMARQSRRPGWWIILCLASWLGIITGSARLQDWQQWQPQNTFPSDNWYFPNTLPASVLYYGPPFYTFYLFKWNGGFSYYIQWLRFTQATVSTQTRLHVDSLSLLHTHTPKKSPGKSIFVSLAKPIGGSRGLEMSVVF